MDKTNETVFSAYVSLKRAAQYLGRRVATVEGLIKAGNLPAQKRGGVFVIRMVDLDAFARMEIERKFKTIEGTL